MNLRSRLESIHFSSNLFKGAIVLITSVRLNILEFNLNNYSPLTVLSAVFFSVGTPHACPSRRYKTLKSIAQRSARSWAKVRSCDESALYNRPLAKKIYVIIRSFNFNRLELTHNCKLLTTNYNVDHNGDGDSDNDSTIF
jgi:hypothetical protein